MKVICQSRSRSEIEIDRCKPLAQDTAYELEIGRAYLVYAQHLVDGCLLYLLVVGEDLGPSRPDWYPASWFVVADSSIPSLWIFSFAREDDLYHRTMWGYPEMVMSYDHYEGLIERREEAILTFLKRKADIDLEQSSEVGAV